MPFEYSSIRIYWLGHASFRVEEVSRRIYLYIDPFQLGISEPKADYILVTHEHFDHCDPPSIKRVYKEGAKVVAPHIALDCAKKSGAKDVVLVDPNRDYTIDDIKVHTTPSYNVSKFRDPRKRVVFHPKEDDRVGYVVQLGGVKIFHTGDSDNIPEFSQLAEFKIDVMLVPVSGVYVMTPEEAVEAVKAVRPKVAIPMHYGSIVASEAEARRFAELARGIAEVVVLPREL